MPDTDMPANDTPVEPVASFPELNKFGTGLGLRAPEIKGHESIVIESHCPSHPVEMFFRSIRRGRMTASSCSSLVISDLPVGVNLKKSSEMYMRDKLWEALSMQHTEIPVCEDFQNDFMLKGKEMEGHALHLVWERVKFDVSMSLRHWSASDRKGRTFIAATPDAVWSKSSFRTENKDLGKWVNIEVKVPSTQPVTKALNLDPEYLLQVAINAAFLAASTGEIETKDQASVYSRYKSNENSAYWQLLRWDRVFLIQLLEGLEQLGTSFLDVIDATSKDPDVLSSALRVLKPTDKEFTGIAKEVLARECDQRSFILPFIEYPVLVAAAEVTGHGHMNVKP